MMKKIFYIPVLLLLFNSCNGSSEDDQNEDDTVIDSTYCNCNELIYDRGYNHFYRFERREPFNGKCEAFYPDSSLKLVKHFNEGKLHGPLTTYHENGQVHEEKEFRMNVQVGEQIVYTKSGKVMFHALYKNGKQEKLIESNPQLSIDD